MDRARVAVAVGLLLAAAPCGARAQDPATVSELAQLLSLEDRRVFDHAVLQRAAQHPQAVIRRRAAMAMGRLRDRAATPLLLALVADADTGVAAEAAFAIGQLGDPGAAEELARRSEAWPMTETGPVEEEVVTALAKLGDRRGAAALEGILRRHAPEQREGDRATATALLEAWRVGGGALTERVLPFARAPNPEWRRNAVYSLARLREPRAAPALVDATGESDPLTRAYAARALSAQLADSSGTSRELFVSRLTALLGDESGQVRVNALRALATFRDSSLAGEVATRLTDRDPNVPVQAALTLGALGGSRAAAALADRTGGGAVGGGARGAAGTFALRRAALLGLAQAEPARLGEFAETWGSHSDWRFRAGFAEALGVAATPDARARLMALADDGDARVAATALGALGQAVPAGDGALRALARSRLAHPDVIVRALATQLLARERDGDLVTELVRAYRRAERDEWSDARLAAVTALAQVAESSPAAWDRVERDFLAAVGRSRDFLVRRAVAERFGADLASRYWGEPYPVETGKSTDDYREVVRRYLLGGGGGGSEAAGPTASTRLLIETERGRIAVELYAHDAPLTVDQFTRLVARRFFDGSRWHRVVPNFVIQDGDPRGDGNGGPGTTIRDEVNRRRYDRGAVGVALSGPDTGGSQFFITHSPQPHLDGTYTVFGQVVEGYDVLDLVVQGDRIVRIVP